MATLYDTVPSELHTRDVGRDARQPLRERLWPTGLHDVRFEPVGNFAGRVAPDDPVGTFGPVRRLRRQGTGTFRGDSDRQRQGSFADRFAPAA